MASARSRTGGFNRTTLNARQRVRRSVTQAAAASALAAAVEQATTRPPAVPLSRQPLRHEQTVDWAGMAAEFIAARTALVAAWQHVRAQQARRLVEQVRKARSLDDLTRIVAPVVGGDVIGEAMAALANFGARSAVREAQAQAVTISTPAQAELAELVQDRAAVTATTLARGLTEAATREAVRVAGGPLSKTTIADQVDQHLTGLSDAFLDEQLGGALQSALNQGRFAAMTGYPAGTVFVSSELLDTNTCPACRAVDGHGFASLDDARLAYPVAGYMDCYGRWRCRGTLVAVAPSEAPASVQ
jgi:hypothetical protein